MSYPYSIHVIDSSYFALTAELSALAQTEHPKRTSGPTGGAEAIAAPSDTLATNLFGAPETRYVIKDL